jgi:hypothetical protein
MILYKPLPEPEPEPLPELDEEVVYPFRLVITICMHVILQRPGNIGVEVNMLRQLPNSPSEHILVQLIQDHTSEEQLFELFRSLVRYVLQIPAGYLSSELVRLQRTINGWLFWRNMEIHPDLLISMFVTIVIINTHPFLTAQLQIDNIIQYVEEATRANPYLAPLLDMLRRPVNERMPELVWNMREAWLAQIMTAFQQLMRNVLRLNAEIQEQSARV